jgi:hypothetical protein
MSNYHILDGRPDGNAIQVVYHLPVLAGDNAVGVTWRNALVMWKQRNTTSILDASLLSAGEQDDLDAGALYEHQEEFNTQPDITLLEKRDALDARFGALSETLIVQLQARLEFYGLSRDVP